MVQNCKHCGEPIVRFPLKDDNGKFIWKNLFKMSIDSIVLVLIVTAMLIAYKYDIAKCDEMLENPLEYCERTNACKIINRQTFIDPAGINVFDFNVTV